MFLAESSTCRPASPDSNYALVNALRTPPGSHWSGEFNGHKPLNEYRLARYLSAFGIRSHNLRIGPTQAKGYELADFTLFADLPP